MLTALIAMVLVFCISITAFAENRYWVGTAANWSSTASWSTSSGGGGGVTVPGASDTAIFDSNGTGNSTLDASFNGTVGAVNVTNGYTGTIIQNRDLSVSGDFNLSTGTWAFTSGTAAALTIGSNMTVNGTIRCQYISTAGNGTGRTFTVDGDLAVGTAGLIDGVGLGFPKGLGPGGWGYNGTAGHGGEAVSGVTYGSIKAPIGLGSGSSHGPGGGAIKLAVTGDTVIDGAIDMDAGVSGYYAPAGGSVFITSRDISGGGTISVNGGNNSADGGAGRIAVVLTNGVSFDNLTITAYAGDGTSGNSGPGTIFLKKSTDTYGELRVDNNGNAPGTKAATILESNRFDRVVITNAGVLALNSTNAVLDISDSGTLSGDTNSYLALDTGDFKPGSSFTLTNLNIAQRGTNSLFINTDLTIGTNGMLTHFGDMVTESHRLNLTINGDLTITNGGSIDGSGKGYFKRYGPGKPADNNSPAAHGGRDGEHQGIDTYGSILAPINWGSGGAYAQGGGSIELHVAGTLNILGDISANGATATFYGGAGGSVYLTAGAITGNVAVTANGSYGAGGGRIAVYLTDAASFGGVTFEALGGSGNGNGGAGTVCLKTKDQAHGTIFIDNNGMSANGDTPIPPTTNTVLMELQDTSLIITNYGNVTMTTNEWVGDILIYTNSSMTLTNFYLHVDSLEHCLENPNDKHPDDSTNRVDHYDQILWEGLPSGMVIIFQ